MHAMQVVGIVGIGAFVLSLGIPLMACTTTERQFSSGGSGGTSGTSSSSGGGMGGMVIGECTSVSDCIATECRMATACTDGVCQWEYLADGTYAASQLYGDCEDRVCDGNGGIKLVAGDPANDSYNWSHPCYLTACNAPAMPMPNDGAMCITAWGKDGICNNFLCAECMVDAECTSQQCRNGRCLLPTCSNQMQDVNETDVDCGGPDCPKCMAGEACLNNADCHGSCDPIISQCIEPSCSDGVKNGTESDIDCGALCGANDPAKKCLEVQQCLFPKDCASGVCIGGICQTPTCKDQVKNQDESGVDCGGSCAIACPTTP